MGIVDKAKDLHRTLANATIPQRVVFHHVPKCGGTSVGRALRRRYLLSQGTVTPESSYRAFKAFTGRDDREQMLVDVLDLREQMLLYLLYEDVRCVSLHVRFSEPAHIQFHEKYKFITILREPVSRFISHYFWSHGKPHAHARIEEPIEEFINTERAKKLGATYAEFFCGLPKDVDFASDEAIQAALANLKKFDVVGRLDDLPAFAGDIKRELGVKLRIGHENRSRKTSSEVKSVISPEVKRKIEELCRPDIKIWEMIWK
ncbi:MAG: sulfotransferase family protein [Candidatus Thiodiazotropha sp. (ex Ctena orbiculata)]|nr:sulfotransferase family protein [Candidatus Thiodiazotropha taylori]MBT3034689.1 sulfotransferase family protein [Candidatus Thiodiazotropha taylori]